MPHTPQDRRIPPVVSLDSSASDAGDSDPNADTMFSWSLLSAWLPLQKYLSVINYVDIFVPCL